MWRFFDERGSELDLIPDSKDFDISAKVIEFKELKWMIYAYGSCLKNRARKAGAVCSVATMLDLLNLIEVSDKVLIF